MSDMSLSAVVPVYRDIDRAVNLVDILLSQNCNECASEYFDIIVVDDGSGEATVSNLRNALPSAVHLISLGENRGRSVARNVGAGASISEAILFLDCDCLPANPRFLTEHLRHLQSGAAASAGSVLGNGRGFWHDFQVGASRGRAAEHAAGLTFVGSTQNLMVQRYAFEAIGGFDERYRSYGFEDRDLLIRLAKLGEVAWAEEAVVEHHDELDLVTVCRKMREGGAGASRIFSHDHPNEYRRLGYAKLDSRLHPTWRFLRPLLDVGLAPAIGVTEKFLESSWIPFRIRAGAVRVFSGLSFLRGTMDREKMD